MRCHTSYLFCSSLCEQTALQLPWKGVLNEIVIEMQSNKSSLELCSWASHTGLVMGSEVFGKIIATKNLNEIKNSTRLLQSNQWKLCNIINHL